jgi:UDP-2,3-diacylglucosamine hydrolase
LGKLSELADQGIDLHFYMGNHDMWAFDYLHHECGMTIHPEPEELLLPCVDGSSQVAFIGHGDGLGDKDRKFLFIRSIFHSPICQWLFRNLFPADWGMEFGLRWAKASRLKHRRKAIAENGDMLNVSDDGTVSNQLGDVLAQNHIPEATFMGEDKEPQVIYAKHHLKLHPQTAYFIFGHRHIELDMMLSRQSRLLIIGEWMQRFTYAVWDGETMLMDNYED